MSAFADELRAAVRAELAPLADQLAKVQAELQALRDQAGEDMLTYSQAAAAVGMTAGAFRVAAASDPALRKLIKGTGRLLRIRRADALAWFASRKVRRGKHAKADNK